MTVVRRRAATTPVPPEPEAVVPEPFLGVRHQRIVVGIDASLTGTAVAFIDLDTGAWVTYRHRPKYKGVRRLLEIQQFILSKVHTAAMLSDSVEHVCMEGYAFSRQMAHSIGEGGGAVKLAIIASLGVNRKAAYPTIVTSNGLKKFVVGSGKNQGEDKVEKSDMKLHVFKKWGIEFRDDNECDAYALAQVARSLVDSEVREALPQYGREVLAKLDIHAEWAEDEVPESLRRPMQKSA